MDNVIYAALKKLGEKYEYIKRLGGGEFSNVYLIKHKTSGKEHAIKILDYHYLLQKLKKDIISDIYTKYNEIKKRFIIEAKLYKKIQHPNIVKIHETGVFSDEKEGIAIPYFIMDYIKGSSLAVLLKNGKPIDVDKTTKIAENVLKALEAIHQNNVIHRDLKPANIMIEEETGEAILIDFGIAKDIVGGTRLTITGALLGSPMYMAPEQFVDSSKVGPALDIYSFGVVMFEMLTGQPPFNESNFIEIMNAHRFKPVPSVIEKNPSLPQGLDNILTKTLAKDPDNRYKSARELLNALHGAGDESSPSHPVKYLRASVILISVTATLALALIDPFHIIKPPVNNGKKPVKTNTNHPNPPLNNPALQAQVNRMTGDFQTLQTLLQKETDNAIKINKCREFLDNYAAIPQTEKTGPMRSKITATITRLETIAQASELYKQYIAAISQALETGDYKKAEEQLALAQSVAVNAIDVNPQKLQDFANTIKIKKTEFDKINGETDFNNFKDTIDLGKYIDFKQKYPDSLFLPEIENRLKTKEPYLPPKKYWNNLLSKNKKGYFEYNFDKTINHHIMIYIPEKNIWIDKYELSNGQFREYLQETNQKPLPKLNDEYIHRDDEYPVVATYAEVEKYCQHYGMRLPSPDEWEFAAGKGINIYPWGNVLPDENAIWRANFDTLEGEQDRDGFKGTAPVKSFERYSSPFDLVNMAGNVWEWVQGTRLKGGGFFSEKDDLKINKSMNAENNEKEGFRCVKDEK